MDSTLAHLHPIRMSDTPRSPEQLQQWANAAALMLDVGYTPQLIRDFGMGISKELAAAMERQQQAQVTS